MKKIKKIVYLIIQVSFICTAAFSQKSAKVKAEEVKSICDVTPLKDRIRMSVTRFNITTKGSEKSKATGNENYNTNWYFNNANEQANPEAGMTELGANMATMLQSSLIFQIILLSFFL